VHAAVVTTLVVAQVGASWHAIEIEPLLSNYPMYSYTYDSPEHFERAQAVVRFESEGIDITDRVRDVGGGRDALLTMVDRTSGPDEPDPELAATLKDFGSRYAQTYASAPREIDVIFLKQQPFDWVAGRYLQPQRERVGTVKLPQ
jgi:hypothetical protein